MNKNLRLIVSLFVLIGILSACGSGTSDVAQQSTLDAISASVRQTSTAQAAIEQNPNVAIETAHALATAQEQSAATQSAKSALSEDDIAATALAEAPILAKLSDFGVDPSKGRLAWIHPPETLEVEGFMNFDYVNYYISIIAQDFVISTDITWDAIGSESSCGFVIRSDGNEDAMNTYLATISRVASGYFLFLTIAKGEAVTGQVYYANRRDPAFDWQNGATNNLTVVGRANRFWIYSNGTLIGEVDPSAKPELLEILPPKPEAPADASNAEAMAQYAIDLANYDAEAAQITAEYRARERALQNADTVFERGFMAFVALSRAGKKATCQFDNGWLWLIE